MGRRTTGHQPVLRDRGSKEALSCPVAVIAPHLLGAMIESHLGDEYVAARVVEVEAYAGEGLDPASHAHRGRTARNGSMFGAPGTAYVYFTYGMHWCLNVTVEPVGRAAAVLLRAGEVTAGIEVARRRRMPVSGQAPSDRDLARGPARLARALGIDGRLDGSDLLNRRSPVHLTLPDGPAARYEAGPRVGITVAAQRPWRFWLPDEPAVSAYRGGGRAGRARKDQS